MPKEKGGLGVLNLRHFGDALRCRWPWLRWFSGSRPWCLVPEPDDKEALALFNCAAFIRLGNGARAKFWTDRWLPDGRSIQEFAPILATFVRKSNIIVAQAIPNHAWIRDIRGGLSAQVVAQYLRLWDLLPDISLSPDRNDEAIWRPSNDGLHSACSAYRLLFPAEYYFCLRQRHFEIQGPSSV